MGGKRDRSGGRGGSGRKVRRGRIGGTYREGRTDSVASAGSAGPSHVRAKKHLGQHFLIDMNIARRIADSLTGGAAGSPEYRIAGSPESGAAAAQHEFPAITSVLEVGPGTGALTQFLLQRNDIDLYATEVDAESVKCLNDKFPQLTPRLFEEDFLKMDLAARFPGGVRVIGNFPYNISSQIFFKILENRDLVPEVVGMVQREVAVRIAEPPGSRDYGILSVLLQAWYGIEYLFTVGENVFVPPPKVKSAVIRLTRNDARSLGCDEKLFVRVVKAAFSQRRKMLKNPLRAVFGALGGEEHRFFTTRAERLSVADFVELTLWVSERMEPPTRSRKPARNGEIE